MTSLVDTVNGVVLSLNTGGPIVFVDEGLDFADGDPTLQATGQSLGTIINSAQGMLLVEAQLSALDTVEQYIVGLSNGTINQSVHLRLNGTEEAVGLVIQIGLVEAFIGGAPAITLDTTYRIAFTWLLNNVYIYLDGLLTGQDTTAVMPTGMNQVDVGTVPTGIGPYHGPIKRIAYWDTADGSTGDQQQFAEDASNGLAVSEADLALNWFWGPPPPDDEEEQGGGSGGPASSSSSVSGYGEWHGNVPQARQRNWNARPPREKQVMRPQFGRNRSPRR